MNKKHEEENSLIVKQKDERIAQLEAERAETEKKGFEKLQSSFEHLGGSFEKVSDKLSLALEKIGEHDMMLSEGKKEFGKLYKLVNRQAQILKKMEQNQNRKAA